MGGFVYQKVNYHSTENIRDSVGGRKSESGPQDSMQKFEGNHLLLYALLGSSICCHFVKIYDTTYCCISRVEGSGVPPGGSCHSLSGFPTMSQA